MPRAARKVSSTGIYHIMIRGIYRSAIFYDEEDKDKFLDILANFKFKLATLVILLLGLTKKLINQYE